jgi:hypothetical protein
MGNRGPKPSGLTILPKPQNKRKSPMPGMTKPARTIWIRTVAAYAPDHFKPQHYGMLRAYCEAEALRDIATRESAKVTIYLYKPKNRSREGIPLGRH